jgi:hypothetical protein
MGTFVASFTASLNAAGNSVTVVDTSNYTASSEPYSGFTGRTLTILLKDGTAYTTVLFPFVNGNGDSVTFALDRDYSLLLTMLCSKAAPVSGSVYIASNIYTFINYTQNFIYGLIQNISANPSLLNDVLFQKSLKTIYNELSNATLAGSTFNDQQSAQSALDRAYYIISNQAIYF